jgi:adenosylhomocysteine nucleosidase
MTINEKKYNNILLVFALESEAGKEFENYNKVFVGIGKVKATYNLTKAIHENNPDLIINLGTGSTTFDRGSVVNCSRFIQRDMDVRALGFQNLKHHFPDEPIVLEYGLNIENLPKGSVVPATNSKWNISIRNIMSSIWKLLHWRKLQSRKESIFFV